MNILSGSWPPDQKKPTIVFIHGSGGSARFWKAQVNGLTDIANTIAVDLPGHGKSFGLGMRSVKEYSDTVADFIRSADLPYPVPCGLSLGGAICLQLILDNREMFSAGILVNTGAKLKVLPLILNMVKNDYRAYIDSFAATAASPSTDFSLLMEIMDENTQCNPYVVYNDFMACNSFDVMNRLTEISIPVLVMTAVDDRLSPPKYGTFLAENIKDSVLVSIEGAGHLSPVEKSEDVNTAIEKFIRNNFKSLTAE
jgi:pimeloyl-ACP methyl ester carboxylesterase